MKTIVWLRIGAGLVAVAGAIALLTGRYGAAAGLGAASSFAVWLSILLAA